MTDIFLFGASGHAKVVIDIIEREKRYVISCIVDDNPALQGTSVWGYIVRGGRDEITAGKGMPWQAVVAIGDNGIRRGIGDWLEERRVSLVSVVHPSAQIGRDAVIGAGSVVMANVAVNPGSVIGRNVILNTGACVDHDCVVADNVHIAPGSTLCGSVRVGRGTFIGAGSTVIQNISIGSNVFVGAGTVVVKDIPDNTKVTGARETVAQPR
jgi:sugar O-acyltransferase (sialic acid O-acetyltransferase NeuD family)